MMNDEPETLNATSEVHRSAVIFPLSLFRTQPFAFTLPLVVYCLLLLIAPERRPYFGDEISAILMTHGSVGQTIEAVAGDVHPPLYFLLLKAVRAVAGERMWALRGLSALFAIAAFPFLWALVRRFFGKSAGVAAWLLATSSFVVFASRFIRYYSLGLLETAVATWLLVLLLERPTRRLWIAYGAIIVLSLYTFYLFAIVVVAHAIVFWVAWRHEPKRFIPPLWVLASACFLFAPWAVVLTHQVGRVGSGAAGAGLGARTVASAAQIAYTFYCFTASDSISPFALPFSATIAVFYALLTALGVRRTWRSRTTRSLVIPAIVTLALTVPAAMRLAGLLHEPFVYVPVRLLFVAPFYLMILACGVLEIGDRRVRRAVLATMTVIQAVSLYNYYFNRQWTNWAYAVPMPEIVAHVEANARRDDLVILDEWNLSSGPFFYWRGEAAVCRFGPMATRWPARLDTAQRVWVVRAVRDQSPGGEMDRLYSHIKRNFFLKEQNGYVRDSPVIYAQKRRWLRREVYPYKIESLLFEPVGGSGKVERK
jgi:4-amino-4-deoxy-L-arabinose transferase-like glycosyltransferase